jgi:voltage-dependent calcium channel L type alpha-1F
VIDFIVIIVCIIAISPLASKFEIFKMFRVLKIARLISKNEGLKIGLLALFQAIPNVIRIVMSLFLFFLIFGIIAIAKFKGKFFSCDQESLIGLEDSNYNINDYYIDNKWDCFNSGAEWVK